MSGYANWEAKCTTCGEQGPVAQDENDEKANEWILQHHADNAGHTAMILAGNEY
jgi:hypothetical protein